MSSVPIEDQPPADGRRRTLGATVKRLLPRTLLWRTLFILAAPTLIIQVVTTYLFFERHFSTLSRSLAFAVAGDIAMVCDQIEREPRNRSQIFADASTSLELMMDFEPEATLGPSRGPRWNPLFEPVLRTALEERVRRRFTISAYIPDDWVEIRVQLSDGVLEVLSPQRRLFSYTAFVFIGWVVGASLLLTGLAVIFMRNQVRPIRRLAIAAEGFGKGRDLAWFKPAGALEVRQAAAAFIRMRDRIRRQIAQRTEMLAGVSHDLRTPLTRMKLQLALLEDGEGTEELRADVAEMEGMIDAYLAFARGEGGEPPETIDLIALIGDVIGALPGGKAIGFSAAEPIEMPIRPLAMRRCLSNLLSNAVRYARRVAVTAESRERTVVIAIDDDGPGIPPDQRDAVFRPFVRLDPSRNIATGGVGLGLTIARDVAHSHGGEIALEDSPLGGLRVLLTLPR
jgi:two-component system osmolarity sensor histidine kinase EnvZ